MEDRFPNGRNLLKQFELEGCGPCAASLIEAMEGVVVGDRVSEAAIEYNLH